MKANELRIGNKFYLPNGKIGTITYHEIRLLTISQDKPNYKPIPLTEEILLKCCVRKDTKEFLFKVLDGYNWIEEKNGEYLWFINRFDFHLKAPLKYLHQLQNLYFALTGEELVVKE
jgi:DNA polymerase III psi subunit